MLPENDPLRSRARFMAENGSGDDKDGEQGRAPEPRDERGGKSEEDSFLEQFENSFPRGGRPGPGNGGRRGPSRMNLLYLLVCCALLAYMLFSMGGGFMGGEQAKEIPANELVSAIEADRVDELSYTVADGSVRGTYWESDKAKQAKDDPVAFTSTYVGSDSLSELMSAHPNIEYTVDTSNPNFWGDFLISVVPTLLLIVLMFYFMRQMMGGNNKTMQFGKANAKVTEATRPKVKFADVAGIDEAVEELQEVRDFLSNPDRYRKLGAKIPRGVLLVGPPGTGKTLLAKAVAGEAGVPFFSISGSDFVEMFVGVGASRVRDLFKEAKAQSPSIIFIDEIDAVGRQRGAGVGGGHDEREQTLNQLLVEMDGFEEHQSVILIAATNRPDILDPALLRPGRFDRQITVDRPDVKLDKIAQLTPGFSGADLGNLMNESALLAARRGRTRIGMDEVTESMERVIAGPARKSRVMTEQERTTIAFHESGHALVGHKLPNADPVHKISIIPRGQALGYTLSLPEEDHFLQTRSSMLDDLAMMLGGRVAEELFCDDITTGASNDLERATKLARNMVTRYGMSENLGSQVYGEANHEVFLGRDFAERSDYSQETARRIDAEVSRLVDEAHEKARRILSDNAEQMRLMAKVLLERETVDGAACQALLDNRWDEYLAGEDEEKRRVAEADEAATAAEKAAAEAAKPEVAEVIEVPSAGGEIRVNKDGSTTVATEGREVTLPPVEEGKDTAADAEDPEGR